jgi:DNA-binding CsgD family transcriptional regulator
VIDPGWVFPAIGVLIGAAGFWRGRLEARRAEARTQRMEERLLNMERLLADSLQKQPPEQAAVEVLKSDLLPPAAHPSAQQLVHDIRGLSDRERALLRLYLDGASSTEVGEAFGISARSVVKLIEQIRNKLAHTGGSRGPEG